MQQALNCTITNNNIRANWYGQIVDRQVGGSLPSPGTTNLKDFSGNAYGSADAGDQPANSAEPGYAAQIPVAYGGSASPRVDSPTSSARRPRTSTHTVARRRRHVRRARFQGSTAANRAPRRRASGLASRVQERVTTGRRSQRPSTCSEGAPPRRSGCGPSPVPLS